MPAIAPAFSERPCAPGGAGGTNAHASPPLQLFVLQYTPTSSPLGWVRPPARQKAADVKLFAGLTFTKTAGRQAEKHPVQLFPP